MVFLFYPSFFFLYAVEKAKTHMSRYQLGLKQIVYFDIRIFFYFQTNSQNILLHIKMVK